MGRNKLSIIGITVSITFFSFLVLAFFIKSIGILLDSWFKNNAMIIMITSGVVLLLLVITGTISLRAMTSRGHGFFS